MNREIYSGEMKAVNHKPMNHPKGTPTLQGREEGSWIRLKASPPLVDYK
jgi:hypothetical protein